MRILLDTNVVLRLVEPLHAQHQLSIDAIDLLRRQGHALLIAPQVLYEFWAVATRPIANNGLGLPPADAKSELVALQRLFRLLRDERAIFSAWEQLVATLQIRGKQAHDARLAAAMQRHNVKYLLTFNTGDFTRYSFVSSLTPRDVVSGEVVI